jgi:Spy/CpxP family protein refolding chaperone
MLGFIIGAVCAIGIAKAVRRRAWHARFGYGSHGCGPGWGHDMGRAGPRSRGGRWALRALFERLETTPGQERAIVSAFDELRENRRVVRDEMRQTRADLARAVEGGLIEDASFEEAFARHDRLLAQLRVSFTEAVKKICEALDAPQRKHLARWLEGGVLRGGMPWGGSEGAWV